MVTNGHVIHVMGRATEPLVCALHQRSVQIRACSKFRKGARGWWRGIVAGRIKRESSTLAKVRVCQGQLRTSMEMHDLQSAWADISRGHLKDNRHPPLPPMSSLNIMKGRTSRMMDKVPKRALEITVPLYL